MQESRWRPVARPSSSQSKEEVQPRHVVEKERHVLRRAGALVDGRIAVGGALQHRDRARRHALVVHERVVELDDLDVGSGIRARRDALGDLPDVAMHAGAHLGVIGPDRAGHLDHVGHDVESRAAIDGRDADHGRRLHQVGPSADHRLQPEHDLRRGRDRVDGAPGVAAMALPAGDLDAQFVGARHRARRGSRSRPARQARVDMQPEHGSPAFGSCSTPSLTIALAPQVLPVKAA